MATERAEESAPKSRSISELQRDAPEIVREATEHGEVAITRYGEVIGYVISPEEREGARRLRDDLGRLIWAVDLKRAMEAAAAGDVIDWEEAATHLRARFIDK